MCKINKCERKTFTFFYIINIQNFAIMLKEFVTNKSLTQLEMKLDENSKNYYQVVTFFRNTHKVWVSKNYKSYEEADKLFSEIAIIEMQ